MPRPAPLATRRADCHTEAMARTPLDDSDSPSGTNQAAGRPWRRWLIIGGIVLVAVVALAALIPRTWAQLVGTVVGGNIALGSTLGIVAGFAFTALPLLLAWWAWRARGTKGWAITLVVLAGILALPNLMTLWIAVGAGGSAHAGQRILDVDGPGFRGGTLIGAAAAGALAIVLIVRAVAAARRAAKIQAEKDRQRAVIEEMVREKDDDAPAS